MLTVSKKSSSEDDLDLIKYGQVRTWTKAKRVLAYTLRFSLVAAAKLNITRINKIMLFDNVQYPLDSIPLSGPEVQLSGKFLIKNHQNIHITEQIVRSLHHPNIQPDYGGVLRCHRRLGKAQLEDSAKYPVIILQQSFLAETIIRDYHQREYPGINHTVALIRQHFWIPKIHSQVTGIIRKCIQCQRFNNLPYRYPTQGDLPKERVIRSAPFQHVGLDYFGPFTIRTTSNSQAKCYGAILTCMVTQMIHLDVVSDLTTTAFLNMLRRFFARRGVLRSITSDNAPTFDLDNTILQENIKAARNDPAIMREQRDIQLSYPLGFTSESEDPHYLPPIEAAAINTKRQAIAALEASCKLTDMFWNTSQAQYLTALREKHTREVSHEKRCSRTPELGTLVLTCDSLQPRHSWKHGVIHQVIIIVIVSNNSNNNEGKIREVVVRLPSQRLIKHPANLLVPLELDDNGSSTKEISKKPKSEEQASTEPSQQRDHSDRNTPVLRTAQQPNNRYDLRPRRKINYTEEKEDTEPIASCKLPHYFKSL
ncbi:hypothetical protein RB195_018588 [Necator americanus]